MTSFWRNDNVIYYMCSGGKVGSIFHTTMMYYHDDVIKWKLFPLYWPFVRGIHRSSVNSPHRGQGRGALLFSLIYAWINGWVNNREAGDLRRLGAYYDVTLMTLLLCCRLYDHAFLGMTSWFRSDLLFLWLHYEGFGQQKRAITWWRHQMEAFSALLAFCAGDSPVPGEFHAQRPVTRSFDIIFDLRLNKRLSKQ